VCVKVTTCDFAHREVRSRDAIVCRGQTGASQPDYCKRVQFIVITILSQSMKFEFFGLDCVNISTYRATDSGRIDGRILVVRPSVCPSCVQLKQSNQVDLLDHPPLN
jgi:hypothetical protein